MARQEATNIFSDGLMSDLHPINTPKSVLTDCLNGTYITYNGNEFILQNDMGNYKLKNCRLPVNFIPVGVKSYADILYIVSYNPITKQVEIGSYPAPQSIFTTGDKPSKIAEKDDLAPFTWEDKTEWVYYDLINAQKKPLFIFTDTNEETFKLNPGDEFQFTGELDSLAFSYQHLNFYVMDEDNKLYDLDDSLLYQEDPTGGFKLTSTEMRKVFWETPGWLAAQYNLYIPDKFNLNIRSLNVPEFLVKDGTNISTLDDSLINWVPAKNHFKVSFDLSSQTIISDRFFQAELNKYIQNNTFNELCVRYIIRTSDNDAGVYGNLVGIIANNEDYRNEGNTFKTGSDDIGDYLYLDVPCIKHNYQDDILTAYTNVSVIWDFINPTNNVGEIDLTNYKGVIELTAYPILNQNEQILKFTQFASTQRHQLNNLKNTNDIDIANSVYKWAIDNDSLTISFNIDGPFINALNFEGFYGITKLKPHTTNKTQYCFPWDDGNATGIGQQTEPDWISINNLSVYGQNTVNYTNAQAIKEDGLYAFSVKLLQEGQQIALKHFLLIPSEIFNEYFGTFDHYRNLTYNDWVGKYIETLNNISLNLDTFQPALGDKVTVTYKWNNMSEPQILEYKDDWETSINKIFTKQYSSYYDNTTASWKIADRPATEDKCNLYLQFSSSSTATITLPDNILIGNLWNPQITITATLKQNYDQPLINLNSIIDKTGELNEPSIEILTEGSSTTINVTNNPVYYREKTISCPYYDDYENMIDSSPKTLIIKAANGSSNSRNVYCNCYYSDKTTTIYCDTTAEKKKWVQLNQGSISKDFNATFGNDFACEPVRLRVEHNTSGVYVRIVQGNGSNQNDFSQTLILAKDKEDNIQAAPSGIIMKAISNTQSKVLPCYIQLTDANGHWNNIRKFLAHLATVVCYDYGETKPGNFAYFTLAKEFETKETITVNQYNLIIKINALNFTEQINWINKPTISVQNIIKDYNLLNVSQVESEKTISNLPLNQQLTISFDYAENSSFQDIFDAINSIIKDNNDDFLELETNNESDTPYERIEYRENWPFTDKTFPDTASTDWDDRFYDYFNKINSGGKWEKSNICYHVNSNDVLRVVTTQKPEDSGKIDIAYFVSQILN